MKKMMKNLTLFLFIISFPFLLVYFLLSFRINQEVFIEYGDHLSWSSILRKADNLNWQSNTEFSDVYNIGEYEINISYLFFHYPITIYVKDTTPPKVELQNVSKYLDEDMPKAEEFINYIDDKSEYNVSISDIKKEAGKQDITIKVTDQYGNETTKSTVLTLLEYKGKPHFEGLKDLETEYGLVPNLKENVYAYDDRFGNLPFEIDASKVNYHKEGTYEIIYSATNPLGDTTKVVRKIRVKKPKIYFKIEHFPTYHQYPNYPNGCESIALYTLLKYYHIQVTPKEIVNKLKKGSGPYWKNNVLYGGNPEVEFVGDPRDKHGYGVYQKPIIDVANQFKPGIIDYSGNSLTSVLELVKRNIPVQVWVSINLKDTKKCASWRHPTTGEKIDWICNLHSVVITGYDSNNVIVSDPYIGKITSYNKRQFEKMYNLFGRRAIYYEK